MQSHGKRAAQRFAAAAGRRRGGQQLPAAAVTVQQRHNSFIKQVMEQVKKDMEKDPKLKQDWEKAQKTTARMAEKGATLEERMGDLGERFSSVSSRTAETFSKLKGSAQSKTSGISEKFTQATEQNESFKKAADSFSAVAGRTKGVFSGIMDKSSKVVNWVGDADKKGEKTKSWKDMRHSMKAHMDEKAAAEEAAKDASKEATAKADGTAAAEGAGAAAKEEVKAAPAEAESALVVSEARGSSWDRFGSGLKDMPFLSSVFENPVFDRLFGESEIAASIREMKDMDYSFHLEEFSEDIEYIVAPHIIRTYLEGDQEALEKHCGEAAFASVNASIKARKDQKLSLDPNILAGPKEMSLVSAKLNDKGPPSFIWTFQMQQVNCLTDSSGEVIEGAVDDIRTVCYAMVVNKHPDIDKALDLEYPWQISELAILWNQPCF